LISGNEIVDGLENEDCGIFAVKSSRSLVRREKAGRTGYSWSVIITATVGNESSSIRIEQKLTRKLLCTPSVVYVCRVVVLLNTLTCTLSSAFCDGLGEKRHEFTDGTLLIERKGGKVGRMA
jgi:hypothetical protein